MPDAEDIERFYDAHATALFAFALHLTHHEAEARDLIQDLFVRLARHPDLLHGIGDPRSFLLRCLRNAAIDLFRRRQSRDQTAESLAQHTANPFAPASNPDEQNFRDALALAMDGLPEDQRSVLHLKLWEGMTFEAIASLLDIPLNTAASRYRYGLDKLRHQLRPLYEELR